ncbi:MAG: VanW family protein [Patescibacteria group bacterium]|jgi:vancomycin resistance protein YoaR|nr:VanW family protein [Patescibacteria group bacterium]
MNIFKHHRTKKILKWLLVLVAFFVLTTAVAISSYFIFEKKYTDKIYPGVYIGNLDLGGKTLIEAEKILNSKINSLDQNGVVFSYQNKQTKIFPTLSSVEGDLAYQIINFNIDSSIKEALKLGREDTPIINLKNKINLFTNKKQTPLFFSLNKEEIYKILKSNFEKFEVVPANASLQYEDKEFTIKEEKFGNVIDYNLAIINLENNLKYFDSSNIQLISKIEKPTIHKNQTTGLEKEAEKIIENAPLIIKFDSEKIDNKLAKDDSWTIDKETLAGLLDLKSTFDPSVEKEKIFVSFSESKVKSYFEENIFNETKIEPQNAKFEIKDGRVVEFQQSKDGLEVNFDASFNLLENKFIGEGEKNITLAITELKSKLRTQNVNDIGINELIGTGHSDFSGSPSNRIHNISTGAAAINGLIIKPDEEFSLMTALGEIDGDSGYLQELVIKGNETIAEYGGGLCQIGTTLFRTVLQSGLPVTMRRNHSYRVSYYEPAGTDATIYDPWPDFKFINDTKDNILIQTRIEGDDIYFDFWGTRDGRIVELTDPTIYNITKPGPTKLIETLNLPVGEKRCTEHAHNGADAYFDYTVTYDEENVVEKRFTSHYVPWQEVCLIGVEKLSSDEEEIVATSTEEIVQ